MRKTKTKNKNKRKKEKKAILFDLDGTIINSIPSYKEEIKRIARKFGIKYDDKKFEKYNGTPIKKQVIKEIKKNKGIKKWFLIPYLIINKKKIINNIIKNINKWPETTKILKKLTKEYEIGIVTSSPKKYLKKALKKEKITQYFKTRIASEDTKKHKPSPEPYLLAAKKLGVKPENCVVIEDAPLGIKAGKKAGMKTIAITTTTKKEELKKMKPDKIINNIKEITPELIKKTIKKTPKKYQKKTKRKK